MSNEALIIEQENRSLSQLFQIQTQSPPNIQNLPRAETIYDIDLNTRIVSAPQMLSIAKDHKAGVVYFRVDRFYDYMDLAETICLIHYVPPGQKTKPKKSYTYVVPFFDTLKESGEGKMIFPWVVSGAATQSEGEIQFAIRFYKIDFDAEEPVLVYNLNTAPAKSKISYGLEADDEAIRIEQDEIISSNLDNIIAQLSNQATQWTVLD